VARIDWSFPEQAKDPWDHLEILGRADARTRNTEARRIVSLANAESTATSDYGGRYPIELLQNGQDASSADGGRVWFHLTETALIVANDGEGFTPERLDALFSYGQSSSSANKQTSKSIGYRGIGFSSVFTITDRPQIVSTGCAFQLDRAAAHRLVETALGTDVARIPARGYPLALTAADLADDRPTVKQLLRNGASTVIRLPLLPEVTWEEVRDHCLEVLRPQTLLFLPKLSRLELSGAFVEDGTATTWARTSTRSAHGEVTRLATDDRVESWLVERDTVEISEAEIAGLANNDLWATVRHLNVAVAFPWTESDAPRTTDGPQRLHVYFPTEIELGRGLIVHGDFFVDSSRRNLLHGRTEELLNDRLFRRSGQLVAEVAARLTPMCGPAPLEALQDLEGGHGVIAPIWTEAFAVLRSRSFVPTVGADLAKPEDTTLLVPGDVLPEEVRSAVAADDSRVRNDLETNAGSAQVLRLLGSVDMEPIHIASALAPDEPNYAAWVTALGDWLSSHPMALANQLRGVLNKRLIVRRARDDAWVTPASVYQRGPDTPVLPRFVQRDEVRLDQKAAQLFGRLQLQALDLTASLDLVLDELENHVAVDLGEARRQALEFAKAAWRQNPSEFARWKRRTHVMVPISVIATVSNDDGTPVIRSEWRKSGKVYFGRAWDPDSAAASIFGRLSRVAFLADDALGEDDRGESYDFFVALGVQSEPRTSSEPDKVARRITVTPWHAALSGIPECREKHSTSRRSLRLAEPALVDLDRLLNDADPESLHALRDYLLRRREPLGAPAILSCEHGHHTGRPPSTQVPSIDQFLLASSAWLPCTDGTLAAASDLWTEVTGSARDLAIRSCALTDADAIKLGVPSLSHPTVASLEAGLRKLAGGNGGDDDHHRWVTGRYLAQRLGTAIRGERSNGKATCPPLPVKCNGVEGWSVEPIICDEPLAHEIPDLALLTVESNHREFASRYRLVRSSSLMNIEPIASGTPTSGAMLTRDLRVELVAALVAAGASLKSTARGIGRLAEQPVGHLRLRVEADGQSFARDVPMYLHKSRDDAESARGELIWSEWNDVAAARLIGDYVEGADRSQLIQLVLTSTGGIAGVDVTDLDRSEAEDALDKYTPDVPDLDDSSPTLASPQREPEPGSHVTPPEDEIEQASSPAITSGTSDTSAPHGPPSAPVANSREPVVARGSSGGDNDDPSRPPAPRGRAGRVPTDDRTASSTKPGRTPRRHDKPVDRRLAVTYVLPPGTHRPHGVRGDEVTAKRLGDLGEQLVVDYEQRFGRHARLMRQNHPGYDIESDDPAGVRRLIEVKSIDGPWTERGVGLSDTQFECALANGPSYYLYVVEHVRDDQRRRIIEIHNPAAKIDRHYFNCGWERLAAAPYDNSTSPVQQISPTADGFRYPIAVTGLVAGAPRRVGWIDAPDGRPAGSEEFVILVEDASLGAHTLHGWARHTSEIDDLEAGDELGVVIADDDGASLITHRRIDQNFDTGELVLVSPNPFHEVESVRLDQAYIIGRLIGSTPYMPQLDGDQAPPNSST
jgi:hypothetical protein